MKEQERKRKPTNKKETKRSIVRSEVLNPICAVVRGGFASFLEKLRSGRENPPLAQTTKRSKRVEYPLPVVMTERSHLFPYRTQKLSSAVVKILYGRLYGKITQC